MLPEGKTPEDKTMLLPCSSRDPATDTGAKSKVTTCVVSSGNSNSELYTITEDSLPSHMRSLIPSHEQHVHDLLTLERTRRRLRYLIICLTVLLALTVVVAVVLVLSFKVGPSTVGEGRVEAAYGGVTSGSQQMEARRIETKVDIKLLGQGRQEKSRWTEFYRQTEPDTQRTPCLNECWTYAAFRFHATCHNGFCRCRGDLYDADTCLPKYNTCKIVRKDPSAATARLLGNNQTTYSCRASSRDSNNVHVISIFGNHRAHSTHVTVTGQSGAGDYLVLVSYHPVQWSVQLPEDTTFRKVLVISKKRLFRLSTTAVSFTGSAHVPEVAYRFSQTGYGEDQNGGHTPELLQFVESEVGQVTSFLGASHADEIWLDISEKLSTPSVLSTQTLMK